jgi:hypothetical protein
MRLLIALVVWAGCAFGAFEVQTAVGHSTGSTAPTSPGGGGGASAGGGSAGGGSSGGGSSGGGSTSGGGSSFDASTVTATDSDSLFHAQNLAKVVAAARSALGAHSKFEQFVVYPGYLSVLSDKNGNELDFYDDAQGNANSDSTGAPASPPLLSLSVVSVATAMAIVKEITTTGKTPLAQLHYIVVDSDGTGKAQWMIYTVTGSRVEYFSTTGRHGKLMELLNSSTTGPTPVTG